MLFLTLKKEEIAATIFSIVIYEFEKSNKNDNIT
jgi:hypothetical protein